MKNKLFSKVLVVMAILFFLTGCIEPMYVGHDRREGRHERHHRSREHRGVDIDIRH